MFGQIVWAETLSERTHKNRQRWQNLRNLVHVIHGRQKERERLSREREEHYQPTWCQKVFRRQKSLFDGIFGTQ